MKRLLMGFIALLGCLPTLLHAQEVEPVMVANEEAARMALCEILEAQYAYRDAHGEFAGDFAALLEAEPPFLEGDWPTDRYGYTERSGYSLFIVGIEGWPDGIQNVDIHAAPLERSVTGRYAYFVDGTGVFRFAEATHANFYSTAMGYGCISSEEVTETTRITNYLHSVVLGQKEYFEGSGVYAPSLRDLAGHFGSGMRDLPDSIENYTVFMNTADAPMEYEVRAYPDGSSGQYFYVNADGVLRMATSLPVGPDSPEYGQTPPEHPAYFSRLVDIMRRNRERALVEMCRVYEAEEAFHDFYGYYTSDFYDLTQGPLPFLEGDWFGSRYGYFYILGGDGDNFTLYGSASTFGVSGMYGLSTDSRGVMLAMRGQDAYEDAPRWGVVCAPEGDLDGDGLSDEDEQALGTNLHDFDTDGDGAHDGDEVESGRDPLVIEGITLAAPNGGETFVRGATTSIAWSSVGNTGAYVKIIAQKGAASGIIASRAPNNGNYDWTISPLYPLGDDFLIEVRSLEFPDILDQSDGLFALIPSNTGSGALTLTRPNGGEVLQRGTTTAIAWTYGAAAGDNVNLYVRRGASFAKIAGPTPNDGHYDWLIPNYPVGDGYTIEIRSVSNPSLKDASDGTFSLTDTPQTTAAIRVTAPNGGETFIRGTVVPITWTSTGEVGEEVRVMLFKDGKTRILVSATPNDGTYEWPVPTNYPLGPGYEIEVKSLSDLSLKDRCDAPFSLADE